MFSIVGGLLFSIVKVGVDSDVYNGDEIKRTVWGAWRTRVMPGIVLIGEELVAVVVTI